MIIPSNMSSWVQNYNNYVEILDCHIVFTQDIKNHQLNNYIDGKIAKLIKRSSSNYSEEDFYGDPLNLSHTNSLRKMEVD